MKQDGPPVTTVKTSDGDMEVHNNLWSACVCITEIFPKKKVLKERMKEKKK